MAQADVARDRVCFGRVDRHLGLSPMVATLGGSNGRRSKSGRKGRYPNGAGLWGDQRMHFGASGGGVTGASLLLLFALSVLTHVVRICVPTNRFIRCRL